MKNKLKRVLALLLSVLLASSELTGLITPAQAAPASATTAFGGTKLDYTAQDNGRPNLFVSFLGDNGSYKPSSGSMFDSKAYLPEGFDRESTNDLSGTSHASLSQWSKYTQNDADGNTIFWVGVGVDRTKILELLAGNEGLASFEAGFYYDSKVVEPYTGGGNFQAVIEKANLSTGGSNNTWNSSYYRVLRAETGVDVQMDPITQEEIALPSNEQIQTNTSNDQTTNPSEWKMTYVSIELKDMEGTNTANCRFSGVYKGVEQLEQEAAAAGKTFSVANDVPAAAGDNTGKDGYQYLLMIPFVLKSYGETDKSHIRLIRNATHFSAGGGKYGVDPYGQWERVTTRTEGSELKLMTNFTGDLLLFADGKNEDVRYEAELIIINGGGAGNTAKLSVDGDPSVWTAYADRSGEIINNLRSGLGMLLEVHRETGYYVDVQVDYQDADDGDVCWDLTHRYTALDTDANDREYTFNIPEITPGVRRVTVTVTFIYEDRDQFKVYLSELHKDQDGKDENRRVGNEATISVNMLPNSSTVQKPLTTTQTTSISSFDPTQSHPNTAHGTLVTHPDGPMVEAESQIDGQYTVFMVEVSTHNDYQAVIQLYDFQSTTTPCTTAITRLDWYDAEELDLTYATDGKYILPQGGTLAFMLPMNDVDVEVTYIPANRHKATLEVYHATDDGATVVDEANTAQLVHTEYDRYNAPQRGYSGVVYEKVDTPNNDHRAVKSGADNKILPWVSSSEAALSGSLGGDTDASGKPLTGTAWKETTDTALGSKALMSLLGDMAMTESNFAAAISGLDVGCLSLFADGYTASSALVGLRKDLQGSTYEDADMADLASYLWEMRQQILADPTLTAKYFKTVYKADGTTPAYTYLDLTVAQVQAYLLQCFKAEEIYRVDRQQYREAQQAYLTQKARYDSLLAADSTGAYTALKLADAPTAPDTVQIDPTTFVRTYQGEDYQNAGSGYLKKYLDYLNGYETYLDAIIADGGMGTHTFTASAPAAVSSETVEILTDEASGFAASSYVDKFTWNTAEPTTNAYIETREDRTVWVALEADSCYEVKSVDLWSVDTDENAQSLIGSVTLVAQYQNIYGFKMPTQDCVVRVTYQKRGTVDLNTTVRVADQSDLPENKATIVAYKAKADSVTPAREEFNNKDSSMTIDSSSVKTKETKDVLVGSVVTATVQVHDDYKVTVTATTSGGITIPITSATAADPADGTVYRFTVPGGTDISSVNLTIIYEKKSNVKNTAHIVTDVVGAADAAAGGNKGYWYTGSGYLTDWMNVPEGKALEAYIAVQPGYYIDSITAYGASGTYTFSYSGNGYNSGNGALNKNASGAKPGTGNDHRVKLTTTMPDEEYWVHVIVKKGVPPVDPSKTLTLTVKDPDNTTTSAANYAWAEIYDDDTASWGHLLPEASTAAAGNVLGKNSSYGGGTLQDTTTVAKGKWVRVKFKAYVEYMADGVTVDPTKSFYVSNVTAGPESLGLALIWEDAETVSFYMPEDNTGINVEFAKYPADSVLPTYKLSVLEKFNNSGTPDTNDYIFQADSTTIRSWAGGKAWTLAVATNPENVPPDSGSVAGGSVTAGTGAAQAGEKVTMSFKIDESKWYIKSVSLLYPGGVRYLGYTEDTSAASGSVKTYTAEFAMPPAQSQFVVTYHAKKDDGAAEDYGLSIRLIDNDNEEIILTDGTKGYYDNAFAATTGLGMTLTVGGSSLTRALQATDHARAGDTVTLNTTVAAAYGFALEYVVITPRELGLSPTWLTADQATFTMPAHDVTVIAKIVKGSRRKFTANLILRAPDGEDINTVGQGSFVQYGAGSGGTNLGSIASYPDNAIFSMLADPGTKYGLDLYAFAGYYIKSITIDPAVGASATWSGNVGYQDGSFVMPRADINVNVWFAKGWPDEIPYDMTLNVYDTDAAIKADGTHNPENYAAFRSAAGTAFASPDSDKVYGSESRTVVGQVYDNDTVVVDIHKAAGYDWGRDTVTVTDRNGNAVSWWYVPGGIAFTAPPSHVTVDVKFVKRTPTDSYTITLIEQGAAGDDTATLTQVGGSSSVTVNSATHSGTISGLFAGDALNLTATPDASRHISAVYAYQTSPTSAHGQTVPVYFLAHGSTYSDASSMAEFVPNGLSGGADGAGQLAMPEGDVTVVVKYASGTIDSDKARVTLWASGPANSGKAELTVAEDSQTLEVKPSLPDVDSCFTSAGNTATVTFTPAAGYGIEKLEVYDKNGNAVAYEWISMVLDSFKYPDGTLSGSDTWPTPAPGVSAPDYVLNDKLQIKLTVPTGGVTVHVTYGAVDSTKNYRVQVVVNNGGDADNDANLRKNGLTPADTWKKMFYTAAGTKIDLDIAVKAGYRVKSIVAIPQGYGISPSLPLGPIYSQQTGFVMPAGDLVVYVEFETDPTPTKTATVAAVGASTLAYNNGNYATITSPLDTTAAHAYVNGTPQSVIARPTVDWVTVDYYWVAGYWVKSVTVTNLAGTVSIPFTQVATTGRHGKITLPMDADDILVTVEYVKDTDDDLKLPEVILHVVDASSGKVLKNDKTRAYGKVTCTTDIPVPTSLGPIPTPNTTGEIAAGEPENTATLKSPAGEKATLEAFVNSGYYIKSAYVYYSDSGQTVHASFTANTGTQTETFAVHPGTNHVYLYVTDQKPDKVEHTVTLTLRGPDNASGTAEIQNTAHAAGATGYYDELTEANVGFAVVDAATNDGISITIKPSPGYVVDYVRVSPVGFPLETTPAYDYVFSGNQITFKMPHINVGILVVLKRGVAVKYTANLHFIPDPQHSYGTGADCTLNAADLATLSWVDGATISITANEKTYHGKDTTNPAVGNSGTDTYSSMEINEGATVTLKGDVYGSDEYVLSAYVLSEYTLVPLKPAAATGRTAAEGLEGLGSGNHEATFTMPSADVDVYLAVTKTPPTGDYHTVVLVTTDKKGTTTNSGDNEGELYERGSTADHLVSKSLGHPGHVALTVTEKDASGKDNYFVAEAKPAAGYQLELPVNASYNTPVYTAQLTPANPGTYIEKVGDRNTAVHMHFISADKLKLTVELEDRENPGNGSVKQTADVTTSGVADLHLESIDAFGAYQVMNGVSSGATINIKVKPHTGYQAYAKITDSTGNVTQIPLGTGTGGYLTGTVPMPDTDSTLTIVFTTGYDATLVLVDQTTAKDHYASMWDTVRDDATHSNKVTAGPSVTTRTISDLPNGDTLVTQMDTDVSAARVTALVTTKYGTGFLTKEASADGHTTGDHYDHTINRSDATVTLIVRDSSDTSHYVAAVELVNAPSGANAGISASTSGLSKGDIWTEAVCNDTVTTTITVPSGYKAEISAKNRSAGATISLSDTTLTADGSVTLTMPAANVLVTVKYVKVSFDLTLRVYVPAGYSGVSTSVTGGSTTITADGDVIRNVATDTKIDLSADAGASGLTIQKIYYRPASGAAVNYPDAVNGTTFAKDFTMPEADTVVWIIYGKAKETGTPPVTDDDYLIASSAESHPDGYHPDNQVTFIGNDSRTTLKDGSTLPYVNPYWVAAYPPQGVEAGDTIRVAYQVAEGYYAEVTAKDAKGNAVAVAQMGYTGNGYAVAQMPASNADLTITVTFHKGELPRDPAGAYLGLVEHGGEAGNNGTLSAVNLSPTLTVAGSDAVNPDAYVEVYGTSVSSGDDLRTLGKWTTGYSISKITMSKQLADGSRTAEAELAMNLYSGTVSARSLAPLLNSGEHVVIKIYYGSIYEATMHLVNADAAAGDEAKATDDRATTATDPDYSDGGFIHATGDKLIDMAGGETVTTTATAGTDRRVVNVIWESAKLGAHSAAKTTGGAYDFTMPSEDVDFYVFYEKDDPANKSYIAKVAFTNDSVHGYDSANAVTIRNDSDLTASGGKYWVSAKGGDRVTVNVTVAAGYQAEIISTKIDDTSKLPTGVSAADSYHYYISRTFFVPNTATGGKEATFSMPVDSDATVTIRYTKGYDLTMELVDTSGKAQAGDPNAAEILVDSAVAITGKNESDPASPSYDPSKTKSGLAGGEKIDTNVTRTTNDKANVSTRVLWYSPLTGTATIKADSAADNGVDQYEMPQSNVTESIFFRDNTKSDNLLAKVQLKGETDINGNSATPIIDASDPTGTTTGTVWTTTEKSHTIELALTVAKGYVAKITVKKDLDGTLLSAKDHNFRYNYVDATTTSRLTDDVPLYDPATATSAVTEVQMGYLDDATCAGSAFAGSVSGTQYFIFEMPDYVGETESDVTVIVEFVYAGSIPQPYDPDHVNSDSYGGTVPNHTGEDLKPAFLKEGFIYGENRGEYAVIDIPTLLESATGALHNTDAHDTADPAGSKVNFRFYLRQDDGAGGDQYVPLTVGTDVELLPYDENSLKAIGDAYNYYDKEFKSAVDSASATAATYVGSKFRLVPKQDATGAYTANGQILYNMLNDRTDNLGSLEKIASTGNAADDYRTRLYVIAQDALGQQSDYTEVWIRPYLSLTVDVLAYGPRHPLTGELYALMTQAELNAAETAAGVTAPATVDAMNFDHYRYDEETLTVTEEELVYEGDPVDCFGLWYFPVSFDSSELLGGFDKDYDPAKTWTENVRRRAGEELIYGFRLTKSGHITYDRVNLNLTDGFTWVSAGTGSGLQKIDTTAALHPNYNAGTFAITDLVYLLAGSVLGEEATGSWEAQAIEQYLIGGSTYTTTRDSASEVNAGDWDHSIYNPLTRAYACDLDSDGRIGMDDLNIIYTPRNWNRRKTSYNWTYIGSTTGVSGGYGTSCLPFGFGGNKGLIGDGKDYAALFSLARQAVIAPYVADDYWDQPSDERREVPLPEVFADVDGTLLDAEQIAAWKEAADLLEESDASSSATEDDLFGGADDFDDPFGGESAETPRGEEVSRPDVDDTVVDLGPAWGEIIGEEASESDDEIAALPEEKDWWDSIFDFGGEEIEETP